MYFLFKYLAILYNLACVLFITGLIGSFFLCVFMYILSFGAVGFTFTKYLCACLSINTLHFLIACWIRFLYVSVGSLFNCVI